MLDVRLNSSLDVSRAPAGVDELPLAAINAHGVPRVIAAIGEKGRVWG